MNKRTVIIFILIFILVPSIGYCDDEVIDKDKIVEEQLKNLKLEELSDIIKDINKSSDEYFPEVNFKGLLISLVKGEQVVNSQEVLKGILNIVFKEVIVNFKLLLKLLVLAIICAILVNLQSAFESDTIGNLAFYVCYIILISLCIKGFSIGIGIARDAIDDMVVFIQALLPTLITLLLAMGGLTSSALFQPLLLGAITITSTIMKDVLLPIVFFSAIIGIVSNISDRIQFSKLSGLLRQISVAIIGITLTVFIGVISIQGITSAQVDGITIKTAKFAVDKFIPIVGKFLSDAMDTVIGCSMLLKNAIGVIGLIVLFIICIMPIIKIIALVFTYKVVTVVIEPISDFRIINCLNEIIKSLIVILGIVISVGMMFFITITIIVGAGNITMMLR